MVTSRDSFGADLLGAPDGDLLAAVLAHYVEAFEGSDDARRWLATLVADREQLAGPVERVVAVASVAEGLLLGAAAHVIETGVRHLHDVEGVSDEDRVGQRVAEGLAVGPREVDHAPGDAVAPVLGASVEPVRWGLGRAVLDDIEQLRRPGDIDDRGHPRPLVPRPLADEQGLVEPERTSPMRPGSSINGVP